MVSQVIYLHLGASEQKLARVRESMLTLTKGWDREQIREIVREALEETVEPIIYAEALDLIEAHRAAGNRVYLVSASPEEIVAAVGRASRCRRGHRHPGVVDEEGRYAGEMEFYAYGPFKAEAIRELAEAEGIDLASPRPTPTPTPTCPCSRRSATRWPSTPTGCWPRWPGSASGRSCSSPSRSVCGTGSACPACR